MGRPSSLRLTIKALRCLSFDAGGKMRTLVVTGRIAEEAVRAQVKGLKDVDVMALPVSVASFLTPKLAAELLKQVDLKGYSMIILPGTVEGDVSLVEQVTGIPTFKGPLHFVDLPDVFESGVKLSKTTPASEMLKEVIENRALSEINAAEANWRNILAESGGIVVGKGKSILPVSDGLPMRVIAELVNAPTMSIDDVVRRVRYYETQGATVIDIGMMAGQPQPEAISPIAEAIRETVDLPVSIDTLDINEIIAAVEADVDLILSIDRGNMDDVAPHITDQAVVVLPTNMKNGWIPRKASERVEALEQNITHAKELGLKKLIGDLIVEPLVWPGLLEGLRSYRDFKSKHPEIPLLFGIGNATELIDADSTGVNAALTALAREAGACMLHVPEHSVKAKGSVRDVVQASRMVYLAERRKTAPKDIGLDLLLLKEKRWKELDYDSSVEVSTKLVRGIGDTDFSPDRSGWFKIHVDREKGEIVAVHYPSQMDKPGAVIKGRIPMEVYQTIVRLNLVSKLEHAAYLGRELEKAYTALKTGRSYQQDEDLF